MKDRNSWSLWVIANAVGELMGLGVAVVIAVAVVQARELPPAIEILIVTAAFLVIGAYEGAIVGVAQWSVLRRLLPSLPARHWVGATMAGAVAAWMLARIPSALADWNQVAGGISQNEPSPGVVVLLSIAAGAALGLILGVAQWLALRKHVSRAAVWIGASALAWAAAMPLIFVAASIPGPHVSMPELAAFALLSIGLAGAVVGAIEGAFFPLLFNGDAT
jgi:hypothetical protein